MAAMNPILGWALAALMVGSAWQFYGWQGVAVGVTAIVFWLLLQFSRALRVLRDAGQAPKGRVPNAVMLHARLRDGMTLTDILRITRSLGEKQGDAPEVYAWRDDAGDSVTVELSGGRCVRRQLARAQGDRSDPAAP
jgi:hypothetical protein